MIDLNEEELLAKGYRKYTGKEVDVFFNGKVCAHSGVCVRGNSEVFDLDRKPWILADNAKKEDLTALIDKCPSGALKYIVKE